uniref:Large ribosomal subunit protein bL25 n=1 Tax=candidate division CPR3 bacterium TaxID=2268181 RepID=A0A7C4R4N5_UNCC3
MNKDLALDTDAEEMFGRMSDHKLNATKRETTGKKVKEIRKEGLIPAVIYGKGKENINLSLNKIEFNKVFLKAGESSLIDLKIEGDSKPHNVLVYEVQYHPTSDEPIHVDFYEVRMDEEVETEIPLNFIGESLAVKDLEGTLITNKTEVTVKCLPANLPQQLDVDISKLATFEDSITAADIKIPADVELITDLEETIALVNPPRSEEELKELESEVVENVEAVEATEEKKEGGETEKESGEEDKKD